MDGYRKLGVVFIVAGSACAVANGALYFWASSQTVSAMGFAGALITIAAGGGLWANNR